MKGSVLREMMIWYVAQFGRVEAERIFRAIPAEPAKVLHRAEPAFGLRPNTWYPMSLLRPMLDAVIEGRTDEGRGFARDANAAVVPRMIRGLYKVFFSVAVTPERYAGHVQEFWSQLHSTGRRSLVLRAKGEAISAVDDWPGHHPLLCWTVIYTMAYVFESMGYRKWEIERVACVAHGGARCETVLRYAKEAPRP